MLKGLGCFKFAATGFCIVALCHGKENGRDFYAVVAIEPEHYQYFKKRYAPGEMSSFRTFGHELVRGWGTEPEPAVLEQLQSRYDIGFGVSEGFLNQFASRLHSAVALTQQSAFASSYAS